DLDAPVRLVDGAGSNVEDSARVHASDVCVAARRDGLGLQGCRVTARPRSHLNGHDSTQIVLDAQPIDDDETRVLRDEREVAAIALAVVGENTVILRSRHEAALPGQFLSAAPDCAHAAAGAIVPD